MNLPGQIKLIKECSDILESYGKYRGQVNALRRLAADLDPVEPVRPTHFTVKALMRSDDDNVSDHVEAVEWLQSLSNDDLAYLCEDTGANETTDGFFYYLDGEIGDNPWGHHVADRLGRYLGAMNGSYERNSVGFSVRLDEEYLHIWVKANRYKAWELYIEGRQ